LGHPARYHENNGRGTCDYSNSNSIGAKHRVYSSPPLIRNAYYWIIYKK